MREVWRALRDVIPLLPGRARLFLTTYIAATTVLSLFDVAAMGLLVLIITPVASGTTVTLPALGEMPESATPWLLLIACTIIVLKSAASVWLHRIATRQFAHYEYQMGERLLRAYLNATWEERSKRSTVDFTRIIDAGVSMVIGGLILAVLLIPGNVLTIVLTLGVLVVAQPATALVTLGYLGVVALLLNQAVTKRTLRAAETDIQNSFRISRLLLEMVEALKEITLRGRLGEVQAVVGRHREDAVRARAQKAFLMAIPRYAYEVALIGGVIVIGGTGYVVGGLQAAIVAVALFAAAGVRLIPALTAIQNSMISASGSLPLVRDVVSSLRGAEANQTNALTVDDRSPLPANPRRLEFRDVHFAYEPDKPVLRGLDLDVPFGSSVALVGPSGAGKSTLVELLLGLRTPTEGSITIDAVPLDDVIHAWRSRIGYVPQRVTLFDGTLGQNVALTWEEDYDRDKVLEVLEKAQLTSLVESRDLGLDARLGERGTTLSGGQQQRLGIARALYADPLVLVLDEATSSLDTKTEDDVIRAIRSLRGEVTVVAIAHRISTIRDYDTICYLERGRILGQGTFDELTAAVPAFGLQAQLAGLAEELDGA